jgi:hypothetical protein
MLSLDHVAFGSRDHEEASASFSALGFTPSETCRCEWEIAGRQDAADAVCIVFEREYLDIIEVSNLRWAQHLASSTLYRRGFAPTGLVFAGVDPKLAFGRLAQRERVPAEPYQITRRFSGDAPVEISYEFLPLRSTGLPFGLIADAVPRALRRAGWLAHPNGAFAVAGVHLRVPSIAGAGAVLREAPLSLATDPADGTGIPVGGPRLHVFQDPPSDYLAAVSALLPDLGRACLLALEFRVSSLEATGKALRHRGVAFTESGLSLLVEPNQGFGAGIIFRRDG